MLGFTCYNDSYTINKLKVELENSPPSPLTPILYMSIKVHNLTEDRVVSIGLICFFSFPEPGLCMNTRYFTSAQTEWTASSSLYDKKGFGLESHTPPLKHLLQTQHNYDE